MIKSQFLLVKSSPHHMLLNSALFAANLRCITRGKSFIFATKWVQKSHQLSWWNHFLRVLDLNSMVDNGSVGKPLRIAIPIWQGSLTTALPMSCRTNCRGAAPPDANRIQGAWQFLCYVQCERLPHMHTIILQIHIIYINRMQYTHISNVHINSMTSNTRLYVRNYVGIIVRVGIDRSNNILFWMCIVAHCAEFSAQKEQPPHHPLRPRQPL